MKNIYQLHAQVKDIQKRCLEGTLDVVDAVDEIDQVIGGILRVDYKTGLKLKFSNGREMYAVDIHGVPKKLIYVLEGLAVVGYRKAQQNGSIQPGEVHIGKDASTRHHREGIERIARRHAA